MCDERGPADLVEDNREEEATTGRRPLPTSNLSMQTLLIRWREMSAEGKGGHLHEPVKLQRTDRR